MNQFARVPQPRKLVERRGSIGALTILGIIFITLKVTNLIDWSWLWVLAPFWLPWALLLSIPVSFVIVSVLVLAGAWVMDCVNGWTRRRRGRKGR